MLITTKGRARRKTLTLAKKAGVEVNAVVFSKKEAEKAIGHSLRGKTATKKDTAFGICWHTEKVIWLNIPVSAETIAHEVMHLVTKTSHREATFRNRVIALADGKNITNVKHNWYEVTETTVRTYRVFQLSAAYARKNYQKGQLQDSTTEIHARRLINRKCRRQ